MPSSNNIRPETPNHALQRTAPAVTLAASAAAFPPAMQPARQPPPSLSLGSLGYFRTYPKSPPFNAHARTILVKAKAHLDHFNEAPPPSPAEISRLKCRLETDGRKGESPATFASEEDANGTEHKKA